MSTSSKMERRTLGRSNVDASVIGMGTWRTFDVRGDKVERDRHRLVDAAVSDGIDLFDSSPMYGQAERILGDAVAAKRNEVLIATKVWSADDNVAERQISDALAFFKGRVDLYQVHNLVAWPRRLDMLERLKGEQKVRAIGATHYSPGSFGQLAEIMRTGRIDAIQVPYNPRQREVESEILPLAAALDLGVLVMQPFGEGGLLRRPPSTSDLEPLRDFGIENWPQALLKWVLSDQRCHVAIPATSSQDHLAENLRAGEEPWLGTEERALITRLAGGR
jgi:aryl-alcohol dehydrogenase-like predicted oxidoreductase